VNYRYKSTRLDHVLVTPVGPFCGLCEMCKSMDCTNNVENRKVCIMGSVRDIRLIIRGDEPSVVIFCEGFVA